MKNKRRLSIDLTPEQYLSIKNKAAERGISMSRLILEALNLQHIPTTQGKTEVLKHEQWADLSDQAFQETLSYLDKHWSSFAEKLSKL